MPGILGIGQHPHVTDEINDLPVRSSSMQTLCAARFLVSALRLALAHLEEVPAAMSSVYNLAKL